MDIQQFNEIAVDITSLQEKINQIGKGFFHSTSLSESISPFNDKIYFGLYDWGLLGAITESTMLLVGDTDRGKTDFAKIIMTALFGEEEKGWHKTDIDVDFGSNIYSDNDFSAITQGKTTQELFFEKPWLTYPGLIWDEPNRAPAKLLNKLLHILEKEFTLENGKKVFAGHEFTIDGNKIRYQLNILSMNEGDEFHGTNEVDRAARRRQTIEIPIDIFPTSMHDKKLIGKYRNGSLFFSSDANHITQVLNIMGSLKTIPISPEAEHLKLYLQSMNSCVHSLSRSKKGINFSEKICKTPQGRHAKEAGCHYLAAYPKKMCPNVYGLSDGVSIQLGRIARGYALIRAVKVIERILNYLAQNRRLSTENYKHMARHTKNMNTFIQQIYRYLGYEDNNAISLDEAVHKFVNTYIKNLKVEPGDIHAVFPFVAYSKLQLNPHWVEREYQGGKWYAVKDIVNLAYTKTIDFQLHHPDLFQAISDNGYIEPGHIRLLTEAYKNDLWLNKSLEAYQLQHREDEYKKDFKKALKNLMSL